MQSKIISLVAMAIFSFAAACSNAQHPYYIDGDSNEAKQGRQDQRELLDGYIPAKPAAAILDVTGYAPGKLNDLKNTVSNKLDKMKRGLDDLIGGGSGDQSDDYSNRAPISPSPRRALDDLSMPTPASRSPQGGALTAAQRRTNLENFAKIAPEGVKFVCNSKPDDKARMDCFEEGRQREAGYNPSDWNANEKESSRFFCKSVPEADLQSCYNYFQQKYANAATSKGDKALQDLISSPYQETTPSRSGGDNSLQQIMGEQQAQEAARRQAELRRQQQLAAQRAAQEAAQAQADAEEQATNDADNAAAVMGIFNAVMGAAGGGPPANVPSVSGSSATPVSTRSKYWQPEPRCQPYGGKIARPEYTCCANAAGNACY